MHRPQEVWCDRARALLLSCLASGYAHIYSPASSHKCGLVIATRLPLRCPAFLQYEGAQGMERRVFQKGAAGGVLDLGGGMGLVIACTHLQSDFWSSSAAPRAVQSLELASFVRKLECDAEQVGLQLLPSCPTIIAGDLNCAAGGAEARTVLGLLSPNVDIVAASTEATPRSLTFPLGVWSRGKRSYLLRTPTKRLDYILLRRSPSTSQDESADGHVSQTLAYSPTTAAPLSDHAPVLMHLRYVRDGCTS